MSIHIPSHLQDAEAELLTAWKRIAELEAQLNAWKRDAVEDDEHAFDANTEIAELNTRIAELEAERDIWQRDADEQMKLRLKAEAERDDAVQRDNVNAALTRAAIHRLEAERDRLLGEIAEIKRNGR